MSNEPIKPGRAFQARVNDWMMACFGAEISADVTERNHRFLEEALELVQACGCTKSEADQLVAYVYGREVGDLPQEIGGVMVTLAALCTAVCWDMALSGELELAWVWTKVDAIRAKQAAKPKHSPLPALISPPEPPLPWLAFDLERASKYAQIHDGATEKLIAIYRAQDEQIVTLTAQLAEARELIGRQLKWSADTMWARDAAALLAALNGDK